MISIPIRVVVDIVGVKVEEVAEAIPLAVGAGWEREANSKA